MSDQVAGGGGVPLLGGRRAGPRPPGPRLDRRGGRGPGPLLLPAPPGRAQKTVLRGANTNGDSDSIVCIAGSISGARLGAEAIPKKWLMRIEKAGALNSLAERLERKQDELQREL